MSLFGQAVAQFNVVGELVERRMLTSEKQKDWKLHLFKIASRGCTIEIQVSESEYNEGSLNSPYQLTGTISVEQGRNKLVADEVKRIAAKAAS